MNGANSPSNDEIRAFLRDLLESAGPDDLLSMLKREPTWLYPDRVSALDDFLSKVDPAKEFISTRYRLGTLRRIVRVAAAASRIDSFAELAQLASQDPFAVWAGLRSTLEAISQRDSGLPYTRFLDLHNEWNERLRQINEIEIFNAGITAMEKKGEPTGLSGMRYYDLARFAVIHAPLAVEESTLLVLAAYANLHIESGEDEAARRLIPVCERLEITAYNAMLLSSAKDDEKVHYRELTSSFAGLWYVIGVPFERYMALIVAIKAGKVDFESSVVHARKIALATLDSYNQSRPAESSILPASRHFYLTTSIAAFAVLTATELQSAEQLDVSLRLFQSLLGGAWWASLSPSEKGSTVYRYCQMLMSNLVDLDHQQERLERARALLTTSINALIPNAHPGLERDLRLTRARVCAELARWNVTLFSDAVDEFWKALDVPWGRFDREARGLGLCDLASALSRDVRRINERIDDDVVDMVYRRALTYLPEKPYRRGRITALVNYAIYLNEKSSGNDSHNQEFALKLIDEALTICSSIEEALTESGMRGKIGSFSIAEPHVHTIHASTWQTRGNIIRARSFGRDSSADTSIRGQLDHRLPSGLSPRIFAAMVSYHEGLKALGGAGNDSIRGLLHLNLGYSLMEEDLTPERVSLALRYFEGAIEFLKDFPADLVRARVAQCEILLATADSLDTDSLVRHSRVLAECANIFDSLQEWELGSNALVLCAQSLLRTDKVAHIAAACELLVRSVDYAQKSGLADLVVRSLQEEARGRICWYQKSGQDTQQLRLAADALESVGHIITTLLNRSSNALTISLTLQGIRASAAADLVWILVKIDDDEYSARLERARFFAASHDTADYRLSARRGTRLGDSRRQAFREEDLLWQRGGDIEVENNLASEVERLEDALTSVGRARELEVILDPSTGSVQTGAEHGVDPDGTLRIQFVVSRWGGVAFVMAKGSQPRRVALDLDLGTLSEWLQGNHDEPGWLASYNQRRLGSKWRSKCEVLVNNLSTWVWEPIFRSSIDLRGATLLVAPGQLNGFPLHACSYGGLLLVEAVTEFAYIPSLYAKIRSVPTTFQDCLCVLSDPVVPAETELPGAVDEIRQIAELLLAHKRNVRVFAHSWGRTGLSAFSTVGSNILDDVVHGAPERDVVASELCEADLFVYAGHGHGTGNFGGYLALVDESSKPSKFSLFKALANAPLVRRTGILLSACETAWEMSGPSLGMSSIVSTFLRLGASFVVGSLWIIGDDKAAQFSTRFVEEILNGASPGRAFLVSLRELVRLGAHISQWGSYCFWLGYGADENVVSKPTLPGHEIQTNRNKASQTLVLHYSGFTIVVNPDLVDGDWCCLVKRGTYFNSAEFAAASGPDDYMGSFVSNAEESINEAKRYIEERESRSRKNKTPSRIESGKGTRVLSGTRRIGRNERCPCGSGKKFKRCCGLP